MMKPAMAKVENKPPENLAATERLSDERLRELVGQGLEPGTESGGEHHDLRVRTLHR